MISARTISVLGIMAASTVLLLCLYACTDIKGDGDFEPAIDDTVGQGNDDSNDNTVPGDPCSADSPWQCDPLTNEGCEGDDVACGFWGGGGAGFYCMTMATEVAGASCDVLSGPWCGPGTYCLVSGEDSAGVCANYCCIDDDCTGDDQCLDIDWSPVDATIGLCGIPAIDPPDAGPDAG